MDPNKHSDQANQLNDITTLANVSTDDSTPNIIWNENEETFLQNLLANTLLTDDLVEKTDLDLGLGFDNLQLNYDSSSTEPLSSQLTIVSLEEPILDHPELLSTQNLLMPDLKDNDDKVFKKPSNDFLTVNGTKNKKKADSAGQNSEANKSKRSVKRSKIASKSNQEIILSKSAPVGKHFKHRMTNASSSSGQNFLKFTQSKNLKQNKKSHKISSSGTVSDSVCVKSTELDKDIFALNQPVTLKRDEFDLQIGELSLLDLHSSEDDSSHHDLNNKKMPIRLAATNSKTDNLSEIISKRIKYTQNSHEQSNGNGECEQKLDKFIKYFKSLDSTEKECSAKKSLDSLLSPPSPPSHKIQNKRKKKEPVESSSSPIVFISLEQPSIPKSTFSLNLENDTLLHMKNLDLNTEQSEPAFSLDLKNKNSRSYLWNLLKENSSQQELTEYLGSSLHDKISFWDLVQLKLKYSKSNHLKTIYEIIDDYTTLYSNMSGLLERFVNEQSNINSLISKSDNSSRSRSSSRNIRKPPSNSLNR
ncbi:hypothetical protein BpHYR1_032504 [Brachionus plicatilis]|uniref:Uncharacterized protein n=1 Tax=Brachionus plicatilis TaxID=10195 RepID=A0A3M7Q446_BRAPC|nr:hypothetical protein BpHYR1_032504 [Brachionus plicatilis]